MKAGPGCECQPVEPPGLMVVVRTTVSVGCLEEIVKPCDLSWNGPRWIRPSVVLCAFEGGVARAAAQDTQVTKNAPSGVNILRFDGDAASIQALVSGQVEGLGGNMFYIDRLNEAKPGYWENKVEFQRIYNGACTRLGEKEMNASVNAFIDQIKANGELAKAHQKWMKLPLPQMPDSIDGVPFTAG